MAMFWDEYGMNTNPRSLPKREHDAHLAIIQGKQEAREKERKKTQSQTGDM